VARKNGKGRGEKYGSLNRACCSLKKRTERGLRLVSPEIKGNKNQVNSERRPRAGVGRAEQKSEHLKKIL